MKSICLTTTPLEYRHMPTNHRRVVAASTSQVWNSSEQNYRHCAWHWWQYLGLSENTGGEAWVALYPLHWPHFATGDQFCIESLKHWKSYWSCKMLHLKSCKMQDFKKWARVQPAETITATNGHTWARGCSGCKHKMDSTFYMISRAPEQKWPVTAMLSDSQQSHRGTKDTST